jgi:hypothetical protein
MNGSWSERLFVIGTQGSYGVRIDVWVGVQSWLISGFEDGIM